MTPADRARLTQIAAWGISRGEPTAEIEGRIASYVQGIEPDEIAEAMYRGLVSVDLAGLIQTGDNARAALAMEGFRNEGVSQVRALYRVRTGSGPDDWRSGAVLTSAGTPPQSVLDYARHDAAELLTRLARVGTPVGGGPNVATPMERTAPDFGNVEIIYVAPL